MAQDQVLTATNASRAFSEVLHRVCYGGESFVIKKGQRIMARIVPVIENEQEISDAEEDSVPGPLPAGILEALETAIESATQPASGDEAEFYRAWMEQVRKVEV